MLGRLSLVLTVSLLCSCSFIFAQKVRPHWQPIQPPRCSTTVVTPIIDLAPPIVAVGAVATGVVTDDIDVGGDQLKTAAALGVILAASPWLISSIYGFYHRSKCKEALIEHERATQQPPAPSSSQTP